MSASQTSLAHEGLSLVESGAHAAAIPKLTAALAGTRSPLWLLARSKAYVGTSQFSLALADANEAWHVGRARANRQHMMQAQYRRAVAYARLGRWADADRACVWAAALARGGPASGGEDPTARDVGDDGVYRVDVPAARAWIETAMNKGRDQKALMDAMADKSPETRTLHMVLVMRGNVLKKIEELDEGSEARKARASMLPDLNEAKPAEDTDEKTRPAAESKDAATVPTTTQTGPATTTPSATLRTQDFQSSITMTLSIFSKGVDASRLTTSFTPTAVVLDPLRYPDGVERPFYVALWGEIDPDQSRCSVTANKVELSLRKKTAGKWARVARDGTVPGPSPVGGTETTEKGETTTLAPKETTSTTTTAATTSTATNSTATATTSSAPAYPTSAKSGSKDWDHIGDDDDDQSSDINYFFKKLYKDATPEQQRAMMKSFVESNGTALSTDWDDVKGRTVETQPPEGVEAKRWT